MSQVLDLSSYRRFFPSLALDVNGNQAIYFDNPGGTQVAQQVIDAMVSYFLEANANSHGAFLTSERTDQVIAVDERRHWNPRLHLLPQHRHHTFIPPPFP